MYTNYHHPNLFNHIMCQFIKLTNQIINVAHIHNIQIKNKIFVIYFSPKNTYKISQQENPIDYHHLQKWIDKLYIREM